MFTSTNAVSLRRKYAFNLKIMLAKHFILLKLMFVGLFIVVASCEEKEETVVTEPDDSPQATLLDKIKASDSLKVISQVIEALDKEATDQLSAVLNGTTDYTLFAPIDDSDTPLVLPLDSDTGAPVFTEEEASLWRAIIRYHLVPGVIKSGDLQNGQTLTTVLGETITINTGNGVFISDATEEDARVVRADVLAKNGIIHFIDKVLVPQPVVDRPEPPQPEANGIREALASDPTLSTFLEAIELFGVDEVFFLKSENGRSNINEATIFAPNNDAFTSLFATLGDNYNSLADFDTPEEKQLWQQALRYHIVPEVRLSTSFTEDNEPLETLLDENLTVGTQTADIQVRDSQSAGLIVGKDKAAGDNIIHTISIVLRPQAFYTAFPVETTNGDTRNMPALFKTRPELSTLVAAIEKVKLSFEYPPGLYDINISTYFAPNNAAFDSLFVTLGDDYNSLDDFDTEVELQTLTNILLHQHSSSYLCYERMLGEGRSTVYPARLINPQVPLAPDRRNELVTAGDASAPVVTIVDYVYRVAGIVEADIVLDRSVPACAEGNTDFVGFTSIVHITDLVLLKPGFLTPNEPD